MFIVSYRDNQYHGHNIRDVFEKLWHAHEDRPIYVENEQGFIRNMFESFVIHTLTIKVAKILNKTLKEDRELTPQEKETIDANIDAIYDFLKILEEKSYLQPQYLFAYAMITEVVYFVKLEEPEKTQLKNAQEDLRIILPAKLMET